MKRYLILSITILFFSSCVVQEKTELVFSETARNPGSVVESSSQIVAIEEKPILMHKSLYASYLYNIFAKPPAAEFFGNAESIIKNNNYLNLQTQAMSTNFGSNYMEDGCDTYSLQAAGRDDYEGEYQYSFNGGKKVYAVYDDNYEPMRDIGEDCMTNSNSASLSSNYLKASDDVFTRQLKIQKCEMIVGSNIKNNIPIALSLFFHHFYKQKNEAMDAYFVPEFNEDNLIIAIKAFYPTMAVEDLAEASLVWQKLDNISDFTETEKWQTTLSGICQSLFWEFL